MTFLRDLHPLDLVRLSAVVGSSWDSLRVANSSILPNGFKNSLDRYWSSSRQALFVLETLIEVNSSITLESVKYTLKYNADVTCFRASQDIILKPSKDIRLDQLSQEDYEVLTKSVGNDWVFIATALRQFLPAGYKKSLQSKPLSDVERAKILFQDILKDAPQTPLSVVKETCLIVFNTSLCSFDPTVAQ